MQIILIKTMHENKKTNACEAVQTCSNPMYKKVFPELRVAAIT